MTRRILSLLAWGVGGLLVALGLTAGAFALAGRDIAEPATPPLFTSSPEPEEAPDGDEISPSRDLEPSVSPTPVADDDNSGPGSDGSDDNSGPGSGSDDDGSGESNSGPGGGSDDNSGPGSGDHDDD